MERFIKQDVSIYLLKKITTWNKNKLYEKFTQNLTTGKRNLNLLLTGSTCDKKDRLWQERIVCVNVSYPVEF